MKKLSSPCLVLIALMLGLGGGFQGGWWTHQHFSDQTELDLKINKQTGKADVVLRALKGLRTGDTNTTPFLECELDESIISIGQLINETPASERRALELPMLTRIRDYRAKFPHKSKQPGFDESIAQAFTLPDEKH